MEPHLDDATVLGLVEGGLAPDVLATADEHLDACASCRDVVALVARSRGELVRGAQLGKYVIGDLLGAGAMGRVYSAWEPELDRRVAIKMLRDERARVVKEAQAMAKLSHPNVVTVHEVGETDDGVYVAMELVAGDNLRAWAKVARTWREVARVLVDVARGLAAVHAAGLVHRDVKPENVIVGDDGRARIGDFGLARADGVPAAGVEASAVAGTPAYMAPEVLRGGRADAASDQFGFGVMAYELVAGRRPWRGASWAELLRAIEAGAPEPLRGVPGWLDAAVRRCVATDPGKRFGAMSDVAALIAARAGRRSPWVWMTAAGMAAVAASAATWLVVREPARAACTVDDTIGGVWTPRARGAVGAAAPAVERWAAEWRDQKLAACRADEPPARIAARERCLDLRRSELATLVSLANGSNDRILDGLAALPSPSECAFVDADPLPADPARATIAHEVAATLTTMRAQIAVGEPQPAAAAELVDKARRSEHAPTIAEALIVSADALHGAGRFAEASAAARDAVAEAERGHADEIAARAWLTRESVAGDRRDLESADDIGAVAAGAVARAGNPARLVATLARMRGLVAYERGQYESARTLLLDARARFVTLAGDKSVEVSAVESALGSVARAAGDLDEAERRHRAALAIDRALRAPTHPDIARDLHNIAGVLRLRGDLDHAEATYREALALEGERTVAAGLTHNSLGLVLMARQDWPAAAKELTLARDILDAAGHGDRAFAEHNLGLVAQATGDHKAALDHFARAAAIYAATIGDSAPAPLRLVEDRARSEAALRGARPAASPVRYERVGIESPKLHPQVPAVTIPATPPPAPAPPPKRDVGVYGSQVSF
jgi:tetratricopeptide (TPR) repeat protein